MLKIEHGNSKTLLFITMIVICIYGCTLRGMENYNSNTEDSWSLLDYGMAPLKWSWTIATWPGRVFVNSLVEKETVNSLLTEETVEKLVENKLTKLVEGITSQEHIISRLERDNFLLKSFVSIVGIGGISVFYFLIKKINATQKEEKKTREKFMQVLMKHNEKIHKELVQKNEKQIKEFMKMLIKEHDKM